MVIRDYENETMGGFYMLIRKHHNVDVLIQMYLQ